VKRKMEEGIWKEEKGEIIRAKGESFIAMHTLD
jgi:hypothetical protein